MCPAQETMRSKAIAIRKNYGLSTASLQGIARVLQKNYSRPGSKSGTLLCVDDLKISLFERIATEEARAAGCTFSRLDDCVALYTPLGGALEQTDRLRSYFVVDRCLPLITTTQMSSTA